MRDAKSLAAEIEADTTALRLAVHAWIREDAPLAAKMNLLPGHVDALMARLAAEIAANQSRAFERGERSMRQRAEDVARAWMMPKLSAAEQDFVSKQHIAERRGRNETVAGIADRIAALQPEGERSNA